MFPSATLSEWVKRLSPPTGITNGRRDLGDFLRVGCTGGGHRNDRLPSATVEEVLENFSRPFPV